MTIPVLSSTFSDRLNPEQAEGVKSENSESLPLSAMQIISNSAQEIVLANDSDLMLNSCERIIKIISTHNLANYQEIKTIVKIVSDFFMPLALPPKLNGLILEQAGAAFLVHPHPRGSSCNSDGNIEKFFPDFGCDIDDILNFLIKKRLSNSLCFTAIIKIINEYRWEKFNNLQKKAVLNLLIETGSNQQHVYPSDILSFFYYVLSYQCATKQDAWRKANSSNIAHLISHCNLEKLVNLEADEFRLAFPIPNAKNWIGQFFDVFDRLCSLSDSIKIRYTASLIVIKLTEAYLSLFSQKEITILLSNVNRYARAKEYSDFYSKKYFEFFVYYTYRYENHLDSQEAICVLETKFPALLKLFGNITAQEFTYERRSAVWNLLEHLSEKKGIECLLLSLYEEVDCILDFNALTKIFLNQHMPFTPLIQLIKSFFRHAEVSDMAKICFFPELAEYASEQQSITKSELNFILSSAILTNYIESINEDSYKKNILKTLIIKPYKVDGILNNFKLKKDGYFIFSELMGRYLEGLIDKQKLLISKLGLRIDYNAIVIFNAFSAIQNFKTTFFISTQTKKRHELAILVNLNTTRHFVASLNKELHHLLLYLGAMFALEAKKSMSHWKLFFNDNFKENSERFQQGLSYLARYKALEANLLERLSNFEKKISAEQRSFFQEIKATVHSKIISLSEEYSRMHQRIFFDLEELPILEKKKLLEAFRDYITLKKLSIQMHYYLSIINDAQVSSLVQECDGLKQDLIILHNYLEAASNCINTMFLNF